MRTVIVLGCVSILVQYWGLLWDISWHQDFGRDSSLSPPHITILLGLLMGAVAVWHGRRELRLSHRHPLGGARLLPVGILWEILALGWDDVWHTFFGPDLEAGIWSPPHLMVSMGVWVQALGCVSAALSSKAPGKPARPLSALLAFATFLAIVSPLWGPIDYRLHHRDPFLYPLVITLTAAFVFLAGRAATKHRWSCTIIAGLYVLVRAFPSLLLWIHGDTVPGYPTPLIVPGLLIDLFLRRTPTPTRRTILVAGTAFAVLPLLEFPLVNLRSAYQWPFEVALLAILPVAAAGMWTGFLGWQVGGWLRRTLPSAGPSAPSVVRGQKPLAKHTPARRGHKYGA
jgi:hypothetical protein